MEDPSAIAASRPHTISYLYDDSGPLYAEKDAAYIAGAVIGSHNGVESRQDCERLCSQSHNCEGYTYLESQKICEEKTGNAFADSPDSPDWVSGIRLSGEFIHRENSYSTGSVLRTTPDVDAVLDCQLICERNADCDSFTFLEAVRACEEKDGTSQVDVPESNKWHSGTRTP